MTPYEELKKKICEALPRLMEIKEGYMFQYEPNPKQNWVSFEAKVINVCCGAQIADTGDYFDTICDFYSKYDGLETRTSDEISDFEPLGIDPTLSDVLQYLKETTDTELTLSVFGLYITDEITWNLSKPLLKDQSKELIEYLLKLK